MELTTPLAPDLVNLGVLLCNHEWDFSLEEFDGIEQWQVYFCFRPVFVPFTNWTCKDIHCTPVAWMLAPWVLYRHATTAVTFSFTRKMNLEIMDHEWCFEAHRESSFINLFDLHCHYIVYTRSAKSQSSWEFNYNALLRKLQKLQIEIVLFSATVFGNEETIPCISQEGHTNQPKHHHPVYPTSDLRYPRPPFLSSTGWELRKSRFLGWWDEEGS